MGFLVPVLGVGRQEPVALRAWLGLPDAPGCSCHISHLLPFPGAPFAGLLMKHRREGLVISLALFTAEWRC